MTQRSQMFLRLLLRSLHYQWRKVFIAWVALALAAFGSALSITLSLSLDHRLAQELSAYGANLTLFPRPGYPLRSSDLESLDYPKAPFLPGKVTLTLPTSSPLSSATLVGTQWDPKLSLFPGWKIQGRLPQGETEALIGSRLARILHLQQGDTFHIRSSEGRRKLRVVGLLTTGGPEEEQIWVQLPLAQRLFQRKDEIAYALLRVPGNILQIEQTALSLERRLPHLQARLIRQVAESEAIVLHRARYLGIGLTLLILLSSALAFGTAMAATALERHREIALMKAMGAGFAQLRGLLLTEAGLLGFLAGIMGWLSARLATPWVLSYLGGSLYSLPYSSLLLLGLVFSSFAILCSFTAIERAVRVQPASVLKGE